MSQPKCDDAPTSVALPEPQLIPYHPMNTLLPYLLLAAIVTLLFIAYSIVRLRSLLVTGAGEAATTRLELQRVETSFRDEFSRQKTELSAKLDQLQDQSLHRGDLVREKIEARLEAIRAGTEDRLRIFGENADTRQTALRSELTDTSSKARAEVREQLTNFQTNQSQQLAGLREEVAKQLTILRDGNDKRLEEIRVTVNEQLQSTLEKRLTESFKLVSERLEQVHKGLGEMGDIANSVGDLRRVLTNVKTRGTWGEVQLGNLLADILTPEQYGINVLVNPGSRDFVEFAVKLPGREGDPVWLPIDAKFPTEDFQRLQEAMDRGDPIAVEAASKALENAIRAFAKTIAGKYLAPPHTTDFALLYLPSESLYAEVLRRPGLVESLQHDYRVTIAGPTTLAVLLNSLQMGFRTLAIQKKSAEVWEVLGAVKTEFGKFSEVLSKVKKKLEEASDQIENTNVRTRAIARKLKQVESLPEADAKLLLPEVPRELEEEPETAV